MLLAPSSVKRQALANDANTKLLGKYDPAASRRQGQVLGGLVLWGGREASCEVGTSSPPLPFAPFPSGEAASWTAPFSEILSPPMRGIRAHTR